MYKRQLHNRSVQQESRGCQVDRRPRRTATRVESSLVSHLIQTPYTVPVFDLMHRPGEMREKSLDVVVPEGFGNAVIGVRTGSALSLIHI